MEHITVEYYCADTSYLSPEAIRESFNLEGPLKMHAGKWLINIQLIHSVVSSEIIPKNSTSDRKSKKRKPGSSSIRPEAGFLANKAGITNILIKKVDKMNDLQARLTQNRKKREEAKREIKRVLDSN
ncbi:hypothetical protein F8M41_004934 [Gigaspora margarita]|uniref:Uncharacterized protein n=1 Tax=Gigaspora margarita TaxID=4874 RepID=A0A8H3XAW7_GIGMA|nr:hypothetical protein F8M41_004934 [Gigaspora margarita]